MEGDTIWRNLKVLLDSPQRRVIESLFVKICRMVSKEYYLEHGFVDAIVKQAKLRDKIANYLEFHGGQQ